MRILMANKFYRVVGGSERYMFDLAGLLETHGHQVFPFAMKHPENVSTPYARHFVSQVDFNHPSFRYNLRYGARIIGKSIYSLESRRKIRALIREVDPDLAHVHLISHQISPSILVELKKQGVPVVQTLHEYKLICPNYRLYDERRGAICEDCRDRRYRRAFLRKCLKDSRSASLLGSLAMFFHKKTGIYEKNVNLFIAPSRFLRDKVIEFGIDEGQVEYLPNFVQVERFTPCYDFEEYFVYAGRLSAEKGLFTLLEAMKKLKGIRLRLVGRGPLEPALRKYVSENRLDNVEFSGFLTGEELISMMARAMFVVLPSEWYENCPMVLLEAFALGKPGLGSNLGGIPDLIEDGRNGLLFKAGDSSDLAEKINHLLRNPNLVRSFSRESRKKAEDAYNAEVHYRKLMAVYARAVGRT